MMVAWREGRIRVRLLEEGETEVGKQTLTGRGRDRTLLAEGNSRPWMRRLDVREDKKEGRREDGGSRALQVRTPTSCHGSNLEQSEPQSACLVLLNCAGYIRDLLAICGSTSLLRPSPRPLFDVSLLPRTPYTAPPTCGAACLTLASSLSRNSNYRCVNPAIHSPYISPMLFPSMSKLCVVCLGPHSPTNGHSTAASRAYELRARLLCLDGLSCLLTSRLPFYIMMRIICAYLASPRSLAVHACLCYDMSSALPNGFIKTTSSHGGLLVIRPIPSFRFKLSSCLAAEYQLRLPALLFRSFPSSKLCPS